MPLPKNDYKYTYTDYQSWNDEERWEIIEGAPYNMTPAPGTFHQEILIELARQISNYLLNKNCKIFSATFDVRFVENNKADNETINIVQPDISIICDYSKLDDKGCKGSPDMIIEIVSPSNAYMDYKIKFKLYEIFGVREYWIVDPTDRIVQVYKLQKNYEYGKPEVYSQEDNISVGIFDDLKIDMGMVFSR